MKLATYRCGEESGWGVVTDAGMVPMGKEWPGVADGLAAGVPALQQALARVDVRRPLFALEWTAPVSSSSKILCVGINYGLHNREMGREVPSNSSVFVRFADSLVGHQQPVLPPLASTHFARGGRSGAFPGTGAPTIIPLRLRATVKQRQ